MFSESTINKIIQWHSNILKGRRVWGGRLRAGEEDIGGYTGAAQHLQRHSRVSNLTTEFKLPHTFLCACSTSLKFELDILRNNSCKDFLLLISFRYLYPYYDENGVGKPWIFGYGTNKTLFELTEYSELDGHFWAMRHGPTSQGWTA